MDIRKKTSIKHRIRFVLAVMVLLIMGYNPMMNYLINQTKKPSGFTGQVITHIWSSYFETLNKWTTRLVPLEEGSIILDVGYGGGSNIKNLYNTVPNSVIYGIDISEESFKTAQKNNKLGVEKEDILLFVQDVAELSFSDATFNTIFVVQSHMYWDELDTGLRQCLRTLVTGGNLVITSEIDKIDYHLPTYKNHTLFKDHLLEIGFKQVNLIIDGNYVAFICTK